MKAAPMAETRRVALLARPGEACERLRKAEEARLPVLSIALGVGYGSIGPFNRAFKARMGMTPTRFRQSAGGSEPPT